MTPLPCPFCGSPNVGIEDGSTFRWIFARCAECGGAAGEVRVQTMGSGTPEEWRKAAEAEAIATWSTRAPDSAPEERE